MRRTIRKRIVHVGAALVLAAPVVAAGFSPLLAWRDPIYIAAGFAGIIGLSLLAVQPVLAAGRMDGLTLRRQKALHRICAGAILAAVVLHIAGLWITSSPDVVDVLLLVSPTPFAIWGVAAMWALLISATVAAMRARLQMSAQLWRRTHMALGAVVALGSVLHTALIEGTMETVSKVAICALVLAATLGALVQLWGKRRRS